MAADACREPVDGDEPVDGPEALRPTADAPAEQQSGEPLVRTEIRLPSTPADVDTHRQARLAIDKAYAKAIAEQIAGGHAFDKHVIERGEFPGITTRGQFASLIEDIVLNGGRRTLSGGRTAYWSDGTVVIRDPGAPDGGTTFRPADGYDYFLGLH